VELKVSKLLSIPSPDKRGGSRGPGIAQGLGRGDGGARSTFYTKNVWGLAGLPLEISTIVIPYRDGSTKARLAAGTAAFLRKPLGDKQFRAFFQSVT